MKRSSKLVLSFLILIMVLGFSLKLWLGPVWWILHRHVHRNGVNATMPFPWAAVTTPDVQGVAAAKVFSHQWNMFWLKQQTEIPPEDYWKKFTSDEWLRRTTEVHKSEGLTVLRKQTFSTSDGEAECYVFADRGQHTLYECLGLEGHLEAGFKLQRDDPKIPEEVLASTKLDR